jgi:hypothetical protein
MLQLVFIVFGGFLHSNLLVLRLLDKTDATRCHFRMKNLTAICQFDVFLNLKSNLEGFKKVLSTIYSIFKVMFKNK